MISDVRRETTRVGGGKTSYDLENKGESPFGIEAALIKPWRIRKKFHVLVQNTDRPQRRNIQKLNYLIEFVPGICGEGAKKFSNCTMCRCVHVYKCQRAVRIFSRVPRVKRVQRFKIALEITRVKFHNSALLAKRVIVYGLKYQILSIEAFLLISQTIDQGDSKTHSVRPSGLTSRRPWRHVTAPKSWWGAGVPLRSIF